MSQPHKLKPSVKSGSGVSRARSFSSFDSKTFAGQVVSDLKAPLQKILAEPTGRSQVAKILQAIRSRLEKQVAAFPTLLDVPHHAARLGRTAKLSAVDKVWTLPVEDLKPAEVIANGLVAMSQASLYRAVLEKKFYSVAPKGLSNGRLFPAWQFVDPVPDLLSPVLERLSHNPPRTIHAFLVTTSDELNELSPAEVLAGRPMATRGKLHPSQDHLLSLPDIKRQGLVQAQIGLTRD